MRGPTCSRSASPLRDGDWPRPFVGDTSISIISSIVKDTPAQVNDVNRALPRELDESSAARSARIERRYQSAKDVRNDLRAEGVTGLWRWLPSRRQSQDRNSARSWAWAALLSVLSRRSWP
jgi:hypothetical protein